MTEGPQVGGDAPRKGRRNPQLAAELLAQQMQEELESSVGEEPVDAGVTFVRSGRHLFLKQASPLKVDDGEPHWFTVGLSDFVDEGDDLEELYDEMKDICRDGVFGMAAETQAALAAIYEESRKAPITPQPRR